MTPRREGSTKRRVHTRPPHGRRRRRAAARTATMPTPTGAPGPRAWPSRERQTGAGRRASRTRSQRGSGKDVSSAAQNAAQTPEPRPKRTELLCAQHAPGRKRRRTLGRQKISSNSRSPQRHHARRRDRAARWRNRQNRSRRTRRYRHPDRIRPHFHPLRIRTSRRPRRIPPRNPLSSST